MVVVIGSECGQMGPNDTSQHPNRPVDLRVAASSKLLFIEVMRAFFEENTIEFNIDPDLTIGLPILLSSEVFSSAYWLLEYSRNQFDHLVLSD